MARGMDLKAVDYVVSYDAPPFVKTYIHRIGRTARAGAAGSSCTILRPAELPFFKEMRGKVDSRPVTLIRMTQDIIAKHTPRYEAALRQLQTVIKPPVSRAISVHDTLLQQLQTRVAAATKE